MDRPTASGIASLAARSEAAVRALASADCRHAAGVHDDDALGLAHGLGAGHGGLQHFQGGPVGQGHGCFGVHHTPSGSVSGDTPLTFRNTE